MADTSCEAGNAVGLWAERKSHLEETTCVKGEREEEATEDMKSRLKLGYMCEKRSIFLMLL